MHIKTETASVTSVTLTFAIGAWFFRTTRRLDMLNTCAILFENPSMHKEIIFPGHESMHINTETASVTSVTLTFEIGA